MNIKRSYILFVLLLFAVQTIYAQLPNDIVAAFEKGNASKLSSYFNPTIELIIIDSEEIYSKAQAEIILSDFFSKNKPSKFSLLHNGGKDSSQYAIGQLVCGTKKYRVTLYLKQISGKTHIHQLRIEKE